MGHTWNYRSSVRGSCESAGCNVQNWRYLAFEGWVYSEVLSCSSRRPRWLERQARDFVSPFFTLEFLRCLCVDVPGGNSAGIEQSEDMKRFLWYVVFNRC